MVNSQKNTKTNSKWLFSISAAALMIGCSTSIAERSPFEIASDSLRRTDSYSGASEVLAPQIQAFKSNRTSVKGQVQLRTAGPFTDSDGVVHRDGAYLEVLLDYATATPDPDSGLFFDQVNWAGGEAAQLADFGERVVDCREDVREIYRVPIGYSGYGHYGGHYGQYGRRGYGGYGYGRHGRNRGHGGSYGRHGGGHHDQTHDDHHDNDNTNHDTGQTANTPTRSGRRGHSDGRIRRDRDRDRSTPRRDDRTTADTNRPVVPAKQPRRRIPMSTIKAEMASQASQNPRSAPTSRSTPPKAARVSRPAPPPPPPPAKQRTRPTKNTSRSTNRAFKNTNNSRTRTRDNINTRLRYDPRSQYNPGYTDYVVSYSCERQESLRIFIPRERLMAAEKNGLLLYLRPRNGIEETVALPPNYISGFLLAAYSPEGQRLTIEGEPVSSKIEPPKAAPPTPKPEPSARTPIIYGGN